MMEAPLIELDHATVMRGEQRALDSLSLRVDAHESIAILGANGSGKSTLIKMLTRELFPLSSERFATLGLEPGGGSPGDLARAMQDDAKRWGPIVKKSGFRAD